MKLRVGLVGLGRWGQRLLDAVLGHPDFDVKGVSDLSDAALLGAPTHLPRFRTVEALFDAPLDGLFVAVDPRSQGGLAAHALRRGLGVFVEKPLSMSLTEAEAMSVGANQVLLVNHLPRYMAVHQKAQELVHGERWGRLRGIFAVRHGARIRPGVDALWTLGPHDMALVRAACGLAGPWTARRDEQGRVIADAVPRSGCRVRLWVGAAEPAYRGLGYWMEGGALWVDERRSEMRLITGENEGFEALFLAQAETNLRAQMMKLVAQSELLESCDDPNPLHSALSDFARVLRGGGRALCDLDEGLQVVRALSEVARFESA